MHQFAKLTRLEAAMPKPTPATPYKYGPGVVTEARIARVFSAIADLEARGEPLPEFDWNAPCPNPVFERAWLALLKFREAETLKADDDNVTQ